MQKRPPGIIPALVQPFLSTHIAGILLVLALGLGAFAVMVTPREEEPQIEVPMADIIVQAPGVGPQEMEKLVATPLEEILWQLQGVEYVYSSSQRDKAVVTVRFLVGQDLEEALVKLHNQIIMHQDMVPSLVQDWLVKPRSVDDVPILNLTLFSPERSDYELRRIGQELLARFSEKENVSRTEIYGGRPRQVRVDLDPQRLAGYGVGPLQVHNALQEADFSLTLGDFPRENQQFTVLGQGQFRAAQEVARTVVASHRGGPVYLEDVASIRDGPAEPESYTRLALSESYQERQGLEQLPQSMPAVTLALAKKKGTNAVDVAQELLQRLQELKPKLLPRDVEVEVTRNYGQTAQDKVSELFGSLFFAVGTVVVLLALTLGWRSALVVALAIPVSFSLALFGSYLLGYTINRVTLFALILSLGLVVDDPITNVDNVKRHMHLGHPGPDYATLAGVSEVFPPVLMSTLAIIASFLPLFFITGMMGPYMAPMAATVPLTVIFSTLCAMTLVPHLCNVLLRRSESGGNQGSGLQHGVPGWVMRGYRRLLLPFLRYRGLRLGLFLGVFLLLLLAASLALFRLVPLKMLPFDNKDEFQVVVDLPEGSTLESTDAVLRDLEAYLTEVPQVTNVSSFAGTASPMDFNSLVRQYYARSNPHQGEIRINLLPKDERDMPSHSLVLDLRRDLQQIVDQHGAKMKLVEIPPGPPVMSTIVAEVYAEPEKTYQEQIQAAAQVKDIMHQEPFVVDVDDSSVARHRRINFVPDKEKAALHGLSTEQLLESVRIALHGAEPAAVHTPWERDPVQVHMILPLSKRSGISELEQLQVQTSQGESVALAELGRFEYAWQEQPVQHKNLRRVVYVTAEMAGQPPGEAVLDMQSRLQKEPLPAGFSLDWRGEGEWKITLDVFRDLGIAFGAAMLGIYLLLVLQTKSLALPFLIMSAIPLTLMGIMPGFFLLNLLIGREIDGFSDPVFFTATAMIGMIALGGIVIRNSLVLIDFIRSAVSKGQEFQEAILQSGAIRLRPIVLTAMTTALGVWPITLDPIFSGLAWALIFGLAASTVFTLVLVPVSYYVLFKPKQ
ncbi:MAG: efflux RND transporter permease subunit [Desulfohalobiaceae bacterium]